MKKCFVYKRYKNSEYQFLGSFWAKDASDAISQLAGYRDSEGNWISFDLIADFASYPSARDYIEIVSHAELGLTTGLTTG